MVQEDGIELSETVFFPQQRYQCGPASLAMLLTAAGISVTPEELVAKIYLPARKGSLQLELIAATRGYGRIPYVINGNIPALSGELRAGRPVLVLQNLGLSFLPIYHYALVIGLLPPDKVILRSGVDRRLLMDLNRFLETWEAAGAWAMIALRPGKLPDTLELTDYLISVNSFEQQGNVSGAETAYRAALTISPENEIALFALANNYLLQGENEPAESLFRRLFQINPDHIAAANNLADLLGRRGCYSASLTLINRAATIAANEKSPLTDIVLQTRQDIIELIQTSDPVSDDTCIDVL